MRGERPTTIKKIMEDDYAEILELTRNARPLM
jgi:hypothetical protein